LISFCRDKKYSINCADEIDVLEPKILLTRSDEEDDDGVSFIDESFTPVLA